jgi:hypothetical protein
MGGLRGPATQPEGRGRAQASGVWQGRAPATKAAATVVHSLRERPGSGGWWESAQRNTTRPPLPGRTCYMRKVNLSPRIHCLLRCRGMPC